MKLLAVDSNSIMNRAFYGVKALSTKAGFPTNAIYGFLNMTLSVMGEISPDAVAFAFDVHHPTFRHEMYSEYKAGRHPTPPELLEQFPVIKELLRELGYKIIECPGFEADDILGTLSYMCEDSGNECVIMTGDRDSLQLVGEHTTVRLAATKMGRPESVMMNREAIMEKYGVTPKELIEVKALMGDASDNIPGVAGIGEKTALSLISKYKSIDYIYDNIESLDERPNLLNKLTEGKERAFFSRTLGTIVKNAPINGDVSFYVPTPPTEKAGEILMNLEMTKIAGKLSLDGSKLKKPAPQNKPKLNLPPIKISTVGEEGLLAFGEKEEKYAVLILTEAGEAKGVLLLGENEGVYAENEGLFFDEALIKILSNEKEKSTDDLKLLSRMALLRGGNIEGFIMDTSLAGYVLDVLGDDYSVEKLADIYNIPKREIEGDLPPELKSKAEVFTLLSKALKEKIEEEGEGSILYDIELPLAKTLSQMELNGFKIDPEGLKEYGNELIEELGEIKEQIYSLVGEEFNILSPKQLSAILFDKLAIMPPKGAKKGKNGYSTDKEVLGEIRALHPVVDLILEFRKLSKLKGTYVEGLLNAIAPDGRVHTRFNQKETRTGRISSLEPNLQNIPIRSEKGSRLRDFFIAEEGNVLIDADYSQIELRVLSHIANDPAMKKAFMEGEDIHLSTAAGIFSLPPDFVTPALRSKAKAVNFGIVYGMGAYSLSKDVNVTVSEAKKYIDNYLATYKGVDEYMKNAIEKAKSQGYAVTAMGRRRYLPELGATNRLSRAFGERVARNMPIQGTAADIIKLAMVKVNEAIKKELPGAKLIMQVHDELIVEAPLEYEEKAKALLKREMEEAVTLSIPLLAETGSGKSWLKAH